MSVLKELYHHSKQKSSRRCAVTSDLYFKPAQGLKLAIRSDGQIIDSHRGGQNMETQWARLPSG